MVGLAPLRTAVLVLGIALGLATSVQAQNVVYHSPNDDGENPGVALNLPVGPWESLFLYLDTGAIASANGVPCSDGNGRELCGYEVIVDALGGAFFVDFIPSNGVVHRLTPTQLETNGIFGTNPQLGPVRIGELKVASSQPGGEVMVMFGQAILAGLQTETIPQAIVAVTPVPEPAVALQLVPGALLLAGLARARRNRR